MSLDSARRFSERAEYYYRYRPSYPTKILKLLKRKIAFNERCVVADIGSGGNTSLDLLRRALA